MDIVIYTPDKIEKYCIELKFSTNGQYPEQMFSVCKDVKFLEQLMKSGFTGCYFMMFTNDKLFWEGPKKRAFTRYLGKLNLSRVGYESQQGKRIKYYILLEKDTK